MSTFKTITASLLLGAIALHAGGDHSTADQPVAEVSQDNGHSLYVGAGFAMADFHACDQAGCNYEDRTYGGLLRVGYDFNDYVGVEGRALRSFWGKGPFGGAPLQHLGLFAKGQLPATDNLNLYGLLGYGQTKNLGNGARLNYFNSGYGASAGLGAEYTFAHKDPACTDDAEACKELSLFLDYQRLLLKSNAPDMDAMTLGLRYDF